MEENKTVNEVVEEPKKEEKKSTSAKTSTAKNSTSSSTKTGTKKTSSTGTKKSSSTKTSSNKKASTTKSTSKKASTPKKEIANPLDEKPVVKKKSTGANSIEKALEKKVVEKNESSDVSKEDMKSRMQRIINASKKLNDSILEDDTKKAQMKEKLANAAQEMEKEFGVVEEEKNSVADSYLERNEKLKGKYADLSAKLAAMMAESNEYTEETFEEKEVLEEQEETIEEVVEPIENAEIEAQEEIIEESTSVENVELPEVAEEVVEPVESNETEVQEEIVEEEQTNLESAIVLDLVKEIKQQEEQNETVQEEKLDETVQQAETVKEVEKQEIIDTSIPELTEKPVEKKSVFKKALEYIVKTMNGMAYGLFATLIIGTILETVAGFLTDGSTAETLLLALAGLLKNLTGFGIGVGIAWGLKYDGIKLIAMACVGAIAAYFSGADYGFKIGDPLTVYLVVIITEILLSQIFRKKTPVDIIIVPLFTSLVSVAVTVLIGKYVAMVTSGLASFIGTATAYQPILMGIVIAVIMGMALTAPISSAAIAAIVFVAPTTGENIEMITQGLAIAGGAALIGCCTQMLGFAIMSRKDNNLGTCIAIGIGTSMLQFKNILKKPIIWLPTIIVSAILGPISTTLIKLECMGTAAGMGTSGLVGMIGTFNQMGTDPKIWMYVIGFEIIAPLVLVLIVDIIFRKCKLIKQDDLKL